MTYKAIALGSAGELIGDDDSFQDVTILVKVLSHGFLGSFPCQSSHKHLCQRRIPHIDGVMLVNIAHRHPEREKETSEKLMNNNQSFKDGL